jgi:hypothetical protein
MGVLIHATGEKHQILHLSLGDSAERIVFEQPGRLPSVQVFERAVPQSPRDYGVRFVTEREAAWEALLE